MHRFIKKPFFPSQSAVGRLTPTFSLKATLRPLQSPLTNSLTHYTRFFSTLSSSYSNRGTPDEESNSESGPVFTWPWMWLDEYAREGQEPEPRFEKLPEVFTTGFMTNKDMKLTEEMETFENIGAGDSFAAPDGLIIEGPAK